MFVDHYIRPNLTSIFISSPTNKLKKKVINTWVFFHIALLERGHCLDRVSSIHWRNTHSFSFSSPIKSAPNSPTHVSLNCFTLDPVVLCNTEPKKLHTIHTHTHKILCFCRSLWIYIDWVSRVRASWDLFLLHPRVIMSQIQASSCLFNFI